MDGQALHFRWGDGAKFVCEETKVIETYVFFRSGKSFDAVLDKSILIHNNL